MTKHDPVKAALADLVFNALTHAIKEMPGTAIDPAHSPLEDCVIEVTQLSDSEAYVSVAGNGKRRFFSIKVQNDRTFGR
jgi:hypothetical protein